MELRSMMGFCHEGYAGKLMLHDSVFASGESSIAHKTVVGTAVQRDKQQ